MTFVCGFTLKSVAKNSQWLKLRNQLQPITTLYVQDNHHEVAQVFSEKFTDSELELHFIRGKKTSSFNHADHSFTI